MIWFLYIGGGIVAFLLIGSLIEHYFQRTRIYIMPIFNQDGTTKALFGIGLAAVVNPTGDSIDIITHKNFHYVNGNKLAVATMRSALRSTLRSEGVDVSHISYVFKVRISYFGDVPEILSCDEIIAYQKVMPKGPPTEDNPKKKPQLQKVARAPMHRLR